MTPSGGSNLAPLWVCEECRRIGPEEEAKRHMRETGHTISALTLAESDGVREIWLREQAERVAGLIGWARMRRLAR